MRPLLFDRHDRVLIHIPPDDVDVRAGDAGWLFRIVVVLAVAFAIGALIYAELTPA